MNLSMNGRTKLQCTDGVGDPRRTGADDGGEDAMDVADAAERAIVYTRKMHEHSMMAFISAKFV